MIQVTVDSGTYEYVISKNGNRLESDKKIIFLYAQTLRGEWTWGGNKIKSHLLSITVSDLIFKVDK